MILLKVKCDQGNLKKKEGLKDAPDLIVKGFKNYFLGENGKTPVFSVEEVKQSSQGIAKTHKLIFNKANQILKKSFLTSIGGDHSITHPLFKAFSKRFNKVGLVYLDAHADCENDTGLPTYEDVLRRIISEGLVKPWNVILIGLRNWTEQEKRFIEQSKIKVFSMKDVANEGVDETIEAVRYLLSRCENVYASFDIDVVDPAFAPGTGWPEPGGLTSREALQFVQALAVLKKVKAFDLVEANTDPATIQLCSKILFEYLSHKQ